MMHNVPHPGEFIREICLEPLNITITEAANRKYKYYSRTSMETVTDFSKIAR